MRFAILILLAVANLSYVHVGATPQVAIVPEGNPTIEAITKALNQGDVATLSQFMGAKVQISVGDNENTYDKAKASEALAAFFNAKKPSGYISMHSGKSKESADQYMIGNLNTQAGVFRVYIYLKTSGTSQSIQEIRFDQ